MALRSKARLMDFRFSMVTELGSSLGASLIRMSLPLQGAVLLIREPGTVLWLEDSRLVVLWRKERQLVMSA